ncbi:MAG TPA: glycine--tRNA ligase subunit beta [Casimicrobiaceae bacterium]|nr:glycine--tRNA ligase subunit beta [Casimicrobiaceae bacterium]
MTGGKAGARTATLVVELFTEELPPKALKRLGEAFADGVVTGLAERGFKTPASIVTPFATPRRLAVAITDVLETSPDQPVVEKLMPASVAFDAAGKATVALQRRLDKMGRGHLAAKGSNAAEGPDNLTIESDGKVDAVFLRSIAKGSPLQNGLQAALEETIERLPIPKVMSYASRGKYYNNEKFVRPVHRLVALHGAEVVHVSALGLDADRVTGGHRALSRADLRIATAEAYEETLRAEGKVIASFAERRGAIAGALAKAAAGATVIMPDSLLDEVTGLVEWPVVLEGRFDRGFLAVPQECLILTMQQNQKYFALADAHGRLVPRFLLVANLETREPAGIVEGNERVLRARLADARFFFDQDCKTPLAARVPKLASIVYHNKLGTQLDRVARIERLAVEIASLTGADCSVSERAAHLAKADLTTDMVGEFPELQGLMGRYYATHDGEPDAIAAAIEQHYWPRYAGDGLPEGPVAQSVALADKLETLAGLFGIGAQPTGDKDPFGLRRHAIGVIRILVEKALPIALPDLIDIAFRAFVDVRAVTDARGELASFVYERLRAYLRDAGYSANEAEAVLSQRPARIDLVPAQAAAVRAFSELPEADTLAGANKRIINILKKSESEAAQVVDRGQLTEGAEHDLYLMFQKLEPIVDDRCAAGDFAGALLALATAKPAVDRFFDDVLVMADDPAVRANRLALLRGVAQTMNRVADISKLAA